MAKKGGQQQLQADLTNDEDLEKFLQKDGLLLIDVYTEWCGPCLALIGSLKKVKLEQGGDDLHLAIAKSDYIDVFERFRNRSEPTWIFASSGKIVNCAFGSNVPELMALILRELDIERKYRKGESKRTFYELTELTPIEQERFNAYQAIIQENERLEVEAAIQRRSDYLRHVTSEIMEHVGDMGVTILMPHAISKDLIKRLNEQAEKFELAQKEKVITQINEEDLEVLSFRCEKPLLPRHVLDHILGKDVYLVCWKIPDNELRPVEEILNEFVEFMTLKPVVLNEDGQPYQNRAPAIIPSLSLLVQPDNESYGVEEECNEEEDLNEEEDGEIKEKHEHEINNEKNVEHANIPTEKIDVLPTIDNISEAGNSEDEEGSVGLLNDMDEMRIPGMWAPTTAKTHAAFIYRFFRQLTDHFLPPDPVPDPPHVAITFDAYKKMDIMAVIEQYPDDILAYGYFTSDDPTSAKLIANSTLRYMKTKPKVEDKLVVKVAKKTSHALLAMTAQGPTYVSQNTEIGLEECNAFFPEGFKTGSEIEEVEGEEEEEEEEVKKKRKRRKKKVIKEGDEGEEVVEEEEGKLKEPITTDGATTPDPGIKTAEVEVQTQP